MKTASILFFPIQLKELEEVATLQELAFQLRLRGIALLNSLATGEITELPEAAKNAFRLVNQRCVEAGLPQLQGDF